MKVKSEVLALVFVLTLATLMVPRAQSAGEANPAAAGDVNGDGSIDIMDLTLIGRALGTDRQSPHGNGWNQWNPSSDIDSDGRVDVSDLATAGKNYGKNRFIITTNGPVTEEFLALLGRSGASVHKVYTLVPGVAVTIGKGVLSRITATGYVKAVYPDGVARAWSQLEGGFLAWDNDMVDVEHVLPDIDGRGVYVAVLDTGLVPCWRDFLPEEKIDTVHAKAFTGMVPTDYPAWDSDTESHGMHVVSTIAGYYYNYFGNHSYVYGVASGAKVIPVKVLNNYGWGWWSDIAAGIEYIALLKPELSAPVVISMSLGGGPSALVRMMVDEAINAGVIVVAAAGNEGTAGMGYPAAYPEVISVAAVGWTFNYYQLDTYKEIWWRYYLYDDVTVPSEVYVAWLSSKPNPALGQTDDLLDVAGPGVMVFGPYLAEGAAAPPWWAIYNPSYPVDYMIPRQYLWLTGTSMSTPHVSGIVALMLQLQPGLNQAEVESLLKSTAIPIPAGSYLHPVFNVLSVWDDNDAGAGLVTALTALEALGITP